MLADSPSPSAPPVIAPPPITPPTADQAGPTQLALENAKTTGKPVTVDALTTQTSLTVANPDGSLTVTSSAQPIRVQKNGVWTPVDATLTKNGDGSYSPTATPSGVTLSGGGNGPLAAFTDPAGHQLTLALPFALPAPTVSGNTATYADVLPGVDVQATVTDQGVFHEVLVVHNAQAAANPALQSLRLATTSNGLTTSTDQNGNIAVKAADGTPAFTAPTPVMWDSTTAPASTPTTPPVANAARAQALPADSTPTSAPASSAAAPPVASVDPAGVASSSKDGPGQNAHITELAVSADNSAITLTPDAAQLTGTGVTYPLYIDPTVAPTGLTNHYAEVKEGCPNQVMYDNPQDNGEGIGYQQYGSGCIGLYRSYYDMNTSSLNSSMIITNSTLNLKETYGADDGCQTAWGIGLNFTGAINNGTTWQAQPNIISGLGQTTVKSATGCSDNQDVVFDVSSVVKQHLGVGDLTFGIYGNEIKYALNYGFMRFSSSPTLVTTYEIPPNTPDSLSISPNPQNPNNSGCSGGTPGWIGRTTPQSNGTSSIWLSARLSTNMPGINLQASSQLSDNMTSDGSGNPYTVSWPSNAPGWVASGTTVQLPIGVSVADGHQYSWQPWALDNYMAGPKASPCVFNVDLTPPSIATFGTSSAFPPLGSGITPTAHAGDPNITIPVSSTDPTPGGCNRNACVKSGVQKFLWSLDTNIPVVGANTIWVTSDSNGTASANIPINLPPNQWGTHTLYVQAVDGAGNTQPTTATYSFYAPWNPNAKVTAGDLTGDGIPDVIVPDLKSGNLTVVPGNNDVSAPPFIASTPATSPEPGTSWNQFAIANRGSLTQSGIDDLFAYSKATKQLYIYKNDATSTPPGTVGHFTKTNDVIGPLAKASCVPTAAIVSCSGYNSKDWTSLTGLTAPGTYSQSIYKANNPNAKPPVAPAPDLITIENGELWYYIAGGAGNSYFYSAYPIGTGDWSNTDLISPGNVGATVSNGTTSGGTPTLWARNRSTGAISTYTLTFDANGTPTSNLAAPVNSTLTSAVAATGGGNLCVDLDHGNTADGAKVQVWSCNGGNPQAVTYGADNSLHVMGKCIDAHTATDGTPIQLWDCNNTGPQQWVPGPYGGSLKNPMSGLCLDDTKGGQAGTQLQLWDCNGTNPQNWAAVTPGNSLPTQQTVLNVGVSSGDYPTITSPGDANGDGNPDLYVESGSGQLFEYPGTSPAGSVAQVGNAVALGTVNNAAPASTAASVALSSHFNSGKCTDANGATVGNPLVLWDCWGGPNQHFSFGSDGTLRSGGLCAGLPSTTTTAADGSTVSSLATGDGSKVVNQQCAANTPGQQWIARSDGSLYNPASGRCLEIPGWNTTNGTALDVWDCLADANQQWTVTPSS
ncbi:hypothetical protein GCM10010442_24980 [Kitasatospora kifunensis]